MGATTEAMPMPSPPSTRQTMRSATPNARPAPSELTTNRVAPMIITGMRPHRSARLPARYAPTAHPSRATATANPVRAALSSKSVLMASSAPLMTEESKPNRKPPSAPAIASAMTFELEAIGAGDGVVDMAHSVAEPHRRER